MRLNFRGKGQVVSLFCAVSSWKIGRKLDEVLIREIQGRKSRGWSCILFFGFCGSSREDSEGIRMSQSTAGGVVRDSKGSTSSLERSSLKSRTFYCISGHDATAAVASSAATVSGRDNINNHLLSATASCGDTSTSCGSIMQAPSSINSYMQPRLPPPGLQTSSMNGGGMVPGVVDNGMSGGGAYPYKETSGPYEAQGGAVYLHHQMRAGSGGGGEHHRPQLVQAGWYAQGGAPAASHAPQNPMSMDPYGTGQVPQGGVEVFDMYRRSFGQDSGISSAASAGQRSMNMCEGMAANAPVQSRMMNHSAGGGHLGFEHSSAAPATVGVAASRNNLVCVATDFLKDYYTRLCYYPSSLASLYLDGAELIYTGKELDSDAVLVTGRSEIEDFFASDTAVKFSGAKIKVEALHPQVSPLSPYAIVLFVKGRVWIPDANLQGGRLPLANNSPSSYHQQPTEDGRLHQPHLGFEKHSMSAGSTQSPSPAAAGSGPMAPSSGSSVSASFTMSDFYHYLCMMPNPSCSSWGGPLHYFVANEHLHVNSLPLSTPFVPQPQPAYGVRKTNHAPPPHSQGRLAVPHDLCNQPPPTSGEQQPQYPPSASGEYQPPSSRASNSQEGPFGQRGVQPEAVGSSAVYQARAGGLEVLSSARRQPDQTQAPPSQIAVTQSPPTQPAAPMPSRNRFAAVGEEIADHLAHSNLMSSASRKTADGDSSSQTGKDEASLSGTTGQGGRGLRSGGIGLKYQITSRRNEQQPQPQRMGPPVVRSGGSVSSARQWSSQEFSLHAAPAAGTDAANLPSNVDELKAQISEAIVAVEACERGSCVDIYRPKNAESSSRPFFFVYVDSHQTMLALKSRGSLALREGVNIVLSPVKPPRSSFYNRGNKFQPNNGPPVAANNLSAAPLVRRTPRQDQGVPQAQTSTSTTMTFDGANSTSADPPSKGGSRAGGFHPRNSRWGNRNNNGSRNSGNNNASRDQAMTTAGRRGRGGRSVNESIRSTELTEKETSSGLKCNTTVATASTDNEAPQLLAADA